MVFEFSALVLQDSVQVSQIEGTVSNSPSPSAVQELNIDTIKPHLQNKVNTQTSAVKQLGVKPLVTDSTSLEQSIDTTVSASLQIVPVKSKYINILENRFGIPDNSKNFSYHSVPVFSEIKQSDKVINASIHTDAHPILHTRLNWTLVIVFACLTLLIVVRNFYDKYLRQVASSLFNLQMGEKMLREKNILVRRAFFMLNINFFIMLSLLFVLFANMNEISISGFFLKDFLIIGAAVLAILLFRLVILKLVGIIFKVQPAVSAYLHNIYLINKNVGLILVPLVFIATYTDPKISKILLYTGLILILVATLFKVLRGIQIIMKNEILLFYSFLYLCTLELLPLVLGSKLIISLR